MAFSWANGSYLLQSVTAFIVRFIHQEYEADREIPSVESISEHESKRNSCHVKSREFYYASFLLSLLKLVNGFNDFVMIHFVDFKSVSYSF